MRRTGRGVALLFAGLLSLTLLSACGGSSSASPESQLCESVNELQNAGSELKTLSLNSTRDEVQQAIDGFLVALGNVTSDIGSVADSDLDNIQKSFDNLSSQLGNLPDSATITDAVAAARQALPQLQAALKQVLNGVDCNS